MAQPGSAARRKPRFRERNSLKPEALPPQEVAAPPPPRRAHRAIPVVWAVPTFTVEQGLYAALLVLGFAVRFWDVGSRAMHGDEAVHAWYAWNLYTGVGYAYDPVYHGPLQFLVTAALFFLFGDSTTTARLMAVLFGSALVILPYALRDWMGRTAALVAALLIAVSPAFVYVSRLERDDIFTATFALTMAIGVFGLVRTGRATFLYLIAASAALSLSAMENTYITLFVFGAYLLVVCISEWLSRSPTSSLVRLWRRTGPLDRPRTLTIAVYLALLVVAFATTVATGSAVPSLIVVAAGVVGLVSRQAALSVAQTAATPFIDAFRDLDRGAWFNALSIVVAILFLTFSTFGSNLHGIWDASQPLLNTNGQTCPGNPFPLNPCRKDILGGLFYWLSQHKVHRGGQPWFYYSFLLGLYEQIALLFGLGGLLWFLRRPTTFTAFLTFWAVLSFGIYSWAGEKFSWLLIHPLLPLTLIAAMFAVDVVREGRAFRVVALVALAVLGLLEVHSTYVLNFLNGADPVEMMVYVQSSPDTPKVANDILSTSYKVTNGNDLHVSIDSTDTWPFAWYLRDMPNVGYPGYPQLLQKPFSSDPVIIVDRSHQPALRPILKNRYTERLYRLRWWFPEDYKTLTWSSFAARAIDPGYWKVVAQWLIERRPFGPRGAVWFYYYVKKGLVSPY